MLIPGVIESKSNFIEHPELIAQRICRYARLVGRENVMAGSDCGFGTWVGQAAVDPDVVWAKMAAMAEGARIAFAGVLEAVAAMGLARPPRGGAGHGLVASRRRGSRRSAPRRSGESRS
jgi:hypothetical protein